MKFKEFINNKEIKITKIYRTFELDNASTFIEFMENGESKEISILPEVLTEQERVSLHFLINNAYKNQQAEIEYISGRELRAKIEAIESSNNPEDIKSEPTSNELELPEEPIELMPIFDEESEEPLNSNLAPFGKLDEIVAEIINADKKQTPDNLDKAPFIPDLDEPEQTPDDSYQDPIIPDLDESKQTPDDSYQTPFIPDLDEPKQTPDDSYQAPFIPDLGEPKQTPDDSYQAPFIPDLDEPKQTPDNLRKMQNNIKGLKITSAFMAIALAVTGLSSIRGCKGSGNGENTNVSALVSDIQSDENLFNINNAEEVSSVAAEVYDDLNNPIAMTVPATTEQDSLIIDPNAIIKGTNHIDTTKLVRLYNITQSDVLIMILVANNISPYDYGYTEDEIMNAIKSGPVQAAHAGGIESVAGAIDNPKYNPYLIESRNNELLPNIFANKYAREFVAEIAASKTSILEAAYNGKNVNNIEAETKKSLANIVKYIVLSEPLTYSDGTTGCLEELDPFAQYVAISYGYAILSASSVQNITITHKEQKWSIESIAGVLSDKTTNVTDSLGQSLQSNCSNTNKVKVLS